MIGYLRTCVRKQLIIALYFESENELKLYKLGHVWFYLGQILNLTKLYNGPGSAVGNVSDCRYLSVCMSLIPARSHTFVEIDHEIISTAILLPSADLKSVVVSYKRKYAHKVLVNSLVKKGKKVVIGELTVPT